MRSHRSSAVSQNRRNDSAFIPPVTGVVDQDTVFIKPNQSFSKNEEYVTPVEPQQPDVAPITRPWWQKALLGCVVAVLVVGGGYYYFKKRAELNKIRVE